MMRSVAQRCFRLSQLFPLPFEGATARRLLQTVLPVVLCLYPGLQAAGSSSALERRGFDAVDTGGLPEIRSHNGVLEATLTAAPLTVHVHGVEFSGAGYNGSYGGPVLRIHPGDRLRLHLVNHMPSAINMHFHGLRVPPSGTADNMHVVVQPGAQFDYDMRIPMDHLPGLFWYHDHAPEQAEAHVMAGLSGALLVEGFSKSLEGLEAIPEKLMVLKDWSQPGCDGDILKTVYHCRIVTINGKTDWRNELPPDGRQIWRISNQGANLTLHITAHGLHLRIIGRDGAPASGGLEAETLDIMPGSRLDVLVQASSALPVSLIAEGVLTGSGDDVTVKRTLGQIVASLHRQAPGAQPQITFPPRADLRLSTIAASRTIVFDENTAATAFTINGKLYERERIDFRIPLGSVEEWTVRNATPDFHVFHMHQLGFEVIEINGVAQPFTGFVDEVRIPEQGDVKLLIPFTDPLIVGHIMFHCHVLKHEDRGMMASLEVFRPGSTPMCKADSMQ